jgi:hypothetical protein
LAGYSYAGYELPICVQANPIQQSSYCLHISQFRPGTGPNQETKPNPPASVPRPDEIRLLIELKNSLGANFAANSVTYRLKTAAIQRNIFVHSWPFSKNHPYSPGCSSSKQSVNCTQNMIP